MEISSKRGSQKAPELPLDLTLVIIITYLSDILGRSDAGGGLSANSASRSFGIFCSEFSASEPTRESKVGDNDVDTDEEMGSMLCCGWMLLVGVLGREVAKEGVMTTGVAALRTVRKHTCACFSYCSRNVVESKQKILTPFFKGREITNYHSFILDSTDRQC